MLGNSSTGAARTPAERAESAFLAYRDRKGRVADFHALRYTFVTELVKADVSPKDAKELARHPTITLTMDRYAHVGIRDTAAAVFAVDTPNISLPEDRADHPSGDRDGRKGATREQQRAGRIEGG